MVLSLPTSQRRWLAGEDLFAYDNFFFKMRGGVFLEMGALDGFTFSNTLLFERYLGWRVRLQG